MTNNDELARKMRKVISHGAPGVWLSPIEVDALLAERDSDNKLIAQLDQRVLDYAGVATAKAQRVSNLEKRIAELEARTVSHDVGVMNIGNPYCEDHLVAWTVTGRQLADGIYYLDARRVGDIKLEVEE